MPAVKSKPFISEVLPDAVSTSIDRTITRDNQQDPVVREAWDNAVDQLIEWGTNPSQLQDEGVDPPTRNALFQAAQWVSASRQKNSAPPHSVVVDPNGGIVFERREHDVTEVVHFWDDGTVEYRRFRGTQLIERRPLT